jgi:hypothetical protein
LAKRRSRTGNSWRMSKISVLTAAVRASPSSSMSAKRDVQFDGPRCQDRSRLPLGGVV